MSISIDEYYVAQEPPTMLWFVKDKHDNIITQFFTQFEAKEFLNRLVKGE